LPERGQGRARQRTLRILERVGLAGFADRSVTALSGGWPASRRRCLLLEPTLVLLDEPLGALDLKLREHELAQCRPPSTAFLYILRPVGGAGHVSRWRYEQGRFEQVGSPRELYHRPATSFVASVQRANANQWRSTAARDNASPATGEGSPCACAFPAARSSSAGRDRRRRHLLRAARGSGARHPAQALPAGQRRFAGRVAAVLFDTPIRRC
jgi:spermidine/putrescine transport system ATP-binding protein